MISLFTKSLAEKKSYYLQTNGKETKNLGVYLFISSSLIDQTV